MTFTKTDIADYMNAANQDRITSNVWLTRANKRGLFNSNSESSYVDFVVPRELFGHLVA